MDATPSHSHYSIAERQRWMATLAHSQPDDLNPLWDALHLNALEWKNIRPAETGLTQIQARTGGSGQRFFLGDATLTRAVIQLSSGTYGYSYQLGRDKSHAERCALIDALLQEREDNITLLENLINPLAALQQERHQQRAQEIAASRVDFFTLVRGDN